MFTFDLVLEKVATRAGLHPDAVDERLVEHPHEVGLLGSQRVLRLVIGGFTPLLLQVVVKKFSYTYPPPLKK